MPLQKVEFSHKLVFEMPASTWFQIMQTKHHLSATAIIWKVCRCWILECA